MLTAKNLKRVESLPHECGYSLGDYDYPFDQSLIAQYPAPCRDDSRLLVLKRATGEIVHTDFRRLPSFLPERTLICLNDTKVISARFTGHKESTGGKVELLLVREMREKEWKVLARGKLREGVKIIIEPGILFATIAEVMGEGFYLARFVTEKDFGQVMEEQGNLPLPPYIERSGNLPANDRKRYQTVYAKTPGAVAAPTAGLHFKAGALEELRRAGHRTCFLTLHVGPGTFLPVRVQDIRDHQMYMESYFISLENLNVLINNGSQPVLAVGTTTTRTLETVWGKLKASGREGGLNGETDLFIYPGYRFKAVDMLLTNFHLPESTLLMMACAFGGYELVMEAYRQAVSLKYRFYSYGDAMLIV